MAGDHAEVDLGGFDAGVAQQGLDVTNVGSAAQHGHRDTVAQQVGMDATRQAGALGQIGEKVPHDEVIVVRLANRQAHIRHRQACCGCREAVESASTRSNL